MSRPQPPAAFAGYAVASGLLAWVFGFGISTLVTNCLACYLAYRALDRLTRPKGGP